MTAYQAKVVKNPELKVILVFIIWKALFAKYGLIQ